MFSHSTIFQTASSSRVVLLNSAAVSLKCPQGSLSVMECSGAVKCTQPQ